MNAKIQRRVTAVARTLNVNITDPVEFELAKGFIGPLAMNFEPADVLRHVRPIWYLYEKALQELRQSLGQVPRK